MFPQFQIDHDEDARPGDCEFCIYLLPMPLEAFQSLQAAQIAAGGRLYSDGTCSSPCPHCGSPVRVSVGVAHGIDDGLFYDLCLSCWYGVQQVFVQK